MLSFRCIRVRRLNIFRTVMREPKDRMELWSSLYSSCAGVNGRGRGLFSNRKSDPVDEALEMLLFAECDPEVGSGGQSRKRLSRYAGLVPDVDGRGSVIAILVVVVGSLPTSNAP